MAELGVIAGVPITLKRSTRRRTVALQVRPGEVTVYAPQRVPISRLQEIVNARRAWVAHHLAQYEARPISSFTYQSGSQVPFLGEQLTLQIQAELKKPARDSLNPSVLHVPPGTPEEVQQHVEEWTKLECLAPYSSLVQQYALKLGAGGKLGRVGVSSAAQRWGSCNATGDIRLHWKLSRAPLDVLNYVALHEAAHLLELNHSARYWAHVQRIMPNWQEHRAWLKRYGGTL